MMADPPPPIAERSPKLLVIGDFFSPTMEPLRVAVENLVNSGADARFLKDMPPRAHVADDRPWFPDLVLICQHEPDEFTTRDVHALIGRHPLARLVCSYGPWCASDGRTRDIWPLAVRVPVELAPERIRRELDVLAGRRSPLPLTASRDEIFLFDNAVD
jgi:hypothetical protein